MGWQWCVLAARWSYTSITFAAGTFSAAALVANPALALAAAAKAESSSTQISWPSWKTPSPAP
jgi:hypothetical protein